MLTRRAPLLASVTLLSTTLLSGCGLISSIPGIGAAGRGAPGAPGAIAPAPPADKPPGAGSGGGDGVIVTPPFGGGGVVAPPAGGVVIPGNPTFVTVHPGQAGLRDVSPVELRSAIDVAGHLIIRVRWWGGIEPCEILDSVNVTRDSSTITIAARVGSPPGGQVVCIDIARDTATLVDLGILAPGAYTIRASTGDAPPLQVTLPEPSPYAS